MWTHGRSSLRAILQCVGPKSSAGLLPAAEAAAGQLAPAQLMPTFAPLKDAARARRYSTGFWDVPAAAARQELYIELHAIRNMLPNRNAFTPHFTPHGVMLMPNSSSHGSSMQVGAAALVPPAHQVVDDEDAAEAELEGGVWADSVRRKRKLKMKKHKMKKRQKKMRHQQ